MSVSETTKATDDRNSGGLTGAWHQAAVGAAVAAGVFSVIVAAFLVHDSLRSQAADIREANELAELKASLREAPRDEELKRQIRELDAALRKRYFGGAHQTATGRYLLVAGVVIFLIGIKSAGALRGKPPMPGPAAPQGAVGRLARMSRWSVGAAALVVGVAAAVLVVASASALPTPPEKAAPAPDGKTLVPYPTDEEIQKNWPRFRGPGGLGIAAATNVPTSWNGKAGEGIAWKTEVPLAAPNSPVVWGNRVFLTGSSKTTREVYGFDADTGRLLWTHPATNVPGSPPKLPDVMEGVGHAASTAASDGRRVYAIFATGDVIALDFQGKRVWARNLGKPENGYGHASSLAMWHDRLLVLYDQATADDGKSKLMALDAATGKTAWETKRDTPNTWATPVVARTPKGDQIICSGDPWLCGYDAATGAELWKADVLGGEIAPSPVYANGRAFVANAGSYAAAVRVDGKGDVTKTHVEWKAEDGLPDIASPLTNGEMFFSLTTDGLLTAYDAKTGKMLWEKEFDEMQFSSSPTLVGDRVYLMNDKGVMLMVAAGREFKELGRAELGEKARTSPAFLDGRIYIRGDKHLFCIGRK